MKIKFLFFALALAAVVGLCSFGKNDTKSGENAGKLSGHTAKEIASLMHAGVNIGNTMECPEGEGDWTMPINKAYVKTLAALGFNAVRIPCAWDSHAADGVIDSEWLDRVDEVIGWVLDAGMYAILNALGWRLDRG